MGLTADVAIDIILYLLTGDSTRRVSCSLQSPDTVYGRNVAAGSDHVAAHLIYYRSYVGHKVHLKLEQGKHKEPTQQRKQERREVGGGTDRNLSHHVSTMEAPPTLVNKWHAGKKGVRRMLGVFSSKTGYFTISHYQQSI